MTEDVNRQVWRSIAVAALQYGATVFLFVSAVHILSPGDAPLFSEATPFFGVSGVRDALLLAVPAVLVFTVRNQGRLQDAANRWTAAGRAVPLWAELSFIAVVLSGFCIPLTAAGMILFLATSDYTYSGIEKWMPQVEDRSTRELSLLQRAVADLDLSQEVQDRAMELLEEARDKDLMRNRDHREMMGAIIYVATREQRDPRTMEEIADVTGASKKRIGDAYRYIGRNTDVRVVPPFPIDYLPRFADKLQLGVQVRERAEDIIDQANEQRILSGKSPKGTAAAALFLAAGIEGDERTMKEVADLLDVTTITIRERTIEFLDELDLTGVPDGYYRLGEQD